MADGTVRFKHGQPLKELWRGGRDSRRKFVRYLRSGNFGDVSKVTNARRGDRVEALKTVKISGKTEDERRAEQSNLVDEVQVMLRVRGHRNVLQVLGCFLWVTEVLTFLEYVSGGCELADVIKRGELAVNGTAAAADDAPTAERAVLRRVLALAQQMASGLAHIHECCVLHNDVRRLARATTRRPFAFRPAPT